MLRHKKCHTVRNHAEIEEDDDIEIEDNEIEIDDSSNEVDNEKASADSMPIFDNIFDILAPGRGFEIAKFRAYLLFEWPLAYINIVKLEILS